MLLFVFDLIYESIVLKPMDFWKELKGKYGNKFEGMFYHKTKLSFKAKKKTFLYYKYIKKEKNYNEAYRFSHVDNKICW